jgi:hypothetical protein
VEEGRGGGNAPAPLQLNALIAKGIVSIFLNTEALCVFWDSALCYRHLGLPLNGIRAPLRYVIGDGCCGETWAHRKMGSTRERVYSSRNDRASMVLGSSLHYRYLCFSLEATLAYFVAFEKII